MDATRGALQTSRQDSRCRSARWRRAVVLGLAATLLLALTPGHAVARPATEGWQDSAVVYSSVVDCASVISGNPRKVPGAGAYVGYYRDVDASSPAPAVGSPAAVQLVVGGVGVPCSDQWFVPGLALPAGVAFDRSQPILCRLDERPYAPCPQWEAVADFLYAPGAVRYRSPDPTGAWAAPAGYTWTFVFPVVASRAQRGAPLTGFAKLFDGNDNPVLSTGVPLSVPDVRTVWRAVPGAGRDVRAGADGDTWLLGRTAVPGGHSIYRRAGGAWTRVPGAAVALDVDPNGRPWIVTASGALYWRVAGSWQRLPGAGRDLRAGADGSVWLLGRTPEAGGYGLYQWTGGGWTKRSGAGVSLDVDAAGRVWLVNAAGAVLRRNGTRWERLPGVGREVRVGAGGTAWLLGRTAVRGGYPVLRWSGARWVSVGGAGTALDVDAAGRPWLVNSAGAVYRRSTG